MELVELKSVWEAVVEESISKDTIDVYGVEQTISKDSNSVLAKIKRVMYFKFLLGFFFLFLFLFLLLGSFLNPEKFTFYEAILDTQDNQIFLVTGILFITAMLSCNYRAFREIIFFEASASTVKESLRRFIGIMEKTIRLNIYISTAFDSIALGWIAYLVNKKAGLVEGAIQLSALVIVAALIGAVVFYFIAHFKQKVKFGNYLDQLKSNLEDLNEN